MANYWLVLTLHCIYGISIILKDCVIIKVQDRDWKGHSPLTSKTKKSSNQCVLTYYDTILEAECCAVT